ncbi:uncharacterized protein BT62DRAFT_57545 [Guyanagaster necrorhizus]|uniref:Uncharacterized protein n=1 Tax=Guyanagaster necrorhizus TaxID=856835 RepID=A0A9P8B0M3_9AGAR|nr:uncharacterized protein BT62DRAFT_57545 [Guyanagaster necrorhizus MCA 3950]KAG7453277.1 hypothetical protein BT62DRAFT_57545 [Guyanagaster necrorhizus MCA 3950]
MLVHILASYPKLFRVTFFSPALLSSISWARVLSATNVKTARFARLKDVHVWCNGREALPVFLVQSQLMLSCHGFVAFAFLAIGKETWIWLTRDMLS